MSDYPLCQQFGIPVKHTDGGIAYCPYADLRRILQKHCKLEQWERWGRGGITAIAEGYFAHDVERFLSGRRNVD